jgi:modification methylase
MGRQMTIARATLIRTARDQAAKRYTFNYDLMKELNDASGSLADCSQ